MNPDNPLEIVDPNAEGVALEGSSDPPPNDAVVATSETEEGEIAPAPDGGPPVSDGSWVPRSRLNQYAERISALEAEATTHQGDAKQFAVLKNLQKALEGEAPEADPESAAIRKELTSRVPDLGWLLDNIEDLKGAVKAIPGFASMQEAHWGTLAQQTTARLYEAATPALGGGDLSPASEQAISRGFYAYVTESTENYRRYLSNDPSLVKDYWEDYTVNVLDPVRRSAGGAVVEATPTGAAPNRRPSVPRGGSGGARPVAGKDTSKMSMDELLDEAWDAKEKAGA